MSVDGFGGLGGYAMFGLVVADSRLDRIFGQDRAVDLDRWQGEFFGDLRVLERSRFVERLALDPFGHERGRGDRRAATVGLETRVFDHAGFGVDLDLQLHDVAAGRCTDHAGAYRVVALLERADVAGIFVVVDDLG